MRWNWKFVDLEMTLVRGSIKRGILFDSWVDCAEQMELFVAEPGPRCILIIAGSNLGILVIRIT